MVAKRTHPEGVGFLPAGTTTPSPAHGDEAAGALFVGCWVWNTETLAWEKTQPVPLEEASFWKDKRYDYSANQMVYKGFNVTHKATEGATTWYIWKMTYTSNQLTRIEGPLQGSWTGRAALAWG